MADNLNGTFNEQVVLTLKLDQWKKSLADAKKAWDDFKSGLGKDADAATGGLGLTGLANSIQEMRNMFEVMLQSSEQVNKRILQIVKSTVEGEVSATKAGNAKKVADEEATNKKILAERAKAMAQLEKDAKRRFDLFGKEQLGQQVAASDPSRMASEAEVSNRLSKSLRFREIEEEKSAKRAIEMRARLERQAYINLWKTLLRQREAEEEKADRARIAREEASRQRKLNGTVRLSSQWLPTEPSEHLKLVKSTRSEYERMWEGFKSGPATTLQHLKAINTEHAKTTAALQQHKSLWDMIVNGGGGGGIKHTLAHLIRFYALWNLLNGAVYAFGQIIAGPFKLIAMGLGYLRETERAADDMVGVIATNARLSKDYAENFRLAKEASVEATKQLQEQAILTGFSAQQLEGTFKALMESGATRYVKTLREMVDLATMFQMALKAAGAGGLAAQTSVQEMGKLFRGIPDKDNKFLVWAFQGSKDAVGEWVKLRDSVKDTRDLVAQLAQRTKPFRDALIEAGKGQAVLLENFKLLTSRTIGAGVEALFEDINGALINMNKWLVDNREKIYRFFASLSEGLRDLLKELGKAANDPEFVDGFLYVFLYVEQILVRTVRKFTDLMKWVSEIRKNGLFGSTDKDKYSDSPEAWREQIEEKVRKNYLPRIQKEGYTEAIHQQIVKEVDELFKAQVARNKNLAEAVAKEETIDESVTRNLNAAKAAAEKWAANNKGKKSTLDLAYDFTDGAGERNDDQRRDVIARYERMKKEIENEISRIDEEYADKRNTLRLRLEDEDINRFQYVDQSVALERERFAKVATEREKITKLLDQTIKEVAGYEAMNPAKLRVDTERLKGAKEDLDRELRQQQVRSNREIAALEVEALREQRRVKQTKLREGLEDTAQAAKDELAIVRANQQAQLLTVVDAFDKESEIRQREFSIRKQQLEYRASELAEGSPQRIEVEAEISRLQKEADNDRDVRLVERTRLQREFNWAFEDHMHQLASVVAQYADLNLALQSILNPEANLLQLDRDRIEANKVLLDQEEARLKVRLESLKAGTDERLKVERLLADVQRAKAQVPVDQVRAELNGMSGPLYNVRSQQLARQSTGRSTIRQFFDQIFGRNFSEAFRGEKGDAKDTTTRLQKFGVGLIGAANALTRFQSVIDAVRQGYQQGGVFGAAGAAVGEAGGLMSAFSGKEGSFGALMGKLGPYAQAVGAIFSVIGGLFTRAAKRIAENVRKDMEATITAFNRGQSTLVDTIANLEKQRNLAITQLSGKKGGKDELDKLLPQFDDQIFSLKKQQEEILQTFQETLDALRLNSDTLTTVKNQWQAINKEVKEYLGAGGDAASAAEYLSLQLGKIRQEAIDQLNDAEQEAIQSINQLNDLLKERQSIINNFKRSEFDLINADAMDRRQAGSISRGRQLEDLRRQHQEELDNIDREISRVQVKVDKEKEIFNLTNDIAELRRRDEELTLIALDKQIQKLKDLQSIVASISLGAGGFTGAGMFGQQNVSIEVNVNAPVSNPTDFGRSIGESLAAEFTRRMRMSPSFA